MTRSELAVVIVAGLVTGYSTPLQSQVRKRVVEAALGLADEIIKQTESLGGEADNET